MELDPPLEIRLEAALRSPTPRAHLQQLMANLLDKGYERETLPALEDFRAKLAGLGRAEDEEFILEVLDGFTSWCNLG